MQNISLISALLTLVLAIPVAAFERPATIVCQVPSRNSAFAAKEIKIIAFDTAEPKAEGLDGGLLDPLEADQFSTRFIFSNECDNYFSFLFFTDDLEKLAKGKLTRVTGLVQASEADDPPGERRAEPVSCSVGH
jgi:hypothetical protein